MQDGKNIDNGDSANFYHKVCLIKEYAVRCDRFYILTSCYSSAKKRRILWFEMS